MVARGGGSAAAASKNASTSSRAQISPAPAATPGAAKLDHDQASVGELRSLALGEIVPGRFQPRKDIEQGALESLAASIRSAGVMQPIAVRPLGADDPRASLGARWEIIAGERRWRAAKIAGLTHVPALVSELDDRGAAEWGLVENLQREDLNTMDRAWGVRTLVETFGISHAEAAERIGLDRSSVSNLVRVTELETSIQEILRKGGLGLGHAKALLGHPVGAAREKLAKLAAAQGWSVRRLEQAAGAAAGLGASGSANAPAEAAPRIDGALRDLERQLGDHLGTKVRVMTGSTRSRGRIVIDFYSLEHFDALSAMMGFRMKA